MSNQGNVQASVRTRSGVTAELDWNGDWHYLWDQEGIADGTFNERMLTWINTELGETYTSLPGAMQAYAESLGFYNWSSMTAIDPGADVYHEQTLTNVNANLHDYTFVMRFRTDGGAEPEPPDFDVTGVKVSVQGAIDKLYIGVVAGAGDDYDAASLTQVFFGGSPGVSQTRDQITESDLTAFTWDKETYLLVSLYSGGTNASGTKNRSFTSYVTTYLSNSVGDEAATLDKTTGYTELTENVWWIPKITFFR